VRASNVVALTTLLCAALGFARSVAAAECVEGIDEATTRSLFDALRQTKPDDGCVLESVSTEKTRIEIVWKKGDRIQEPIVVMRAPCTERPAVGGKELSTIVPPSTAELCPAAVLATEALVERQLLDAAASSPPTEPQPVPSAARPWPPIRRLAVAVGLAAAVVAALLVLLRGRIRGGTVPCAWLVDRLARARATARDRRPVGWMALALLGPHMAFGTWLFVVPDHVAFRVTQGVLLTHVVVAALTAPIVALWIVRHVIARPPNPRSPRRWAISSMRAGLLAAVIVAAATGVWACWSGRIGVGASLHGVIGMLCGVPFALHLLLERRPVSAGIVTVLVVVSLGSAGWARRDLPGDAERPASPAWEARNAPAGAYDPPSWCGGCHAEIYAEWSRSTHARTMRLPTVDREMRAKMASAGVSFVDTDLEHMPSNSGLCSHCHAPTSFYGDDERPIVETAEGITCAFCHTLRGLRWPGAESRFAPRIAGQTPDLRQANFYVSAPQTVRKYLGQGSDSALLRRVGDWLIRWRPEMHSRDYRTPFLESSEVCKGCHGLHPELSPYSPWKASRFGRGGATPVTECQDCHMVRELTGEPVRQPGRLVEWGPIRGQRRTHLFTGGNVAAAEEAHDDDLALREHEIAARGMSVFIEGWDVSDGAAVIHVTVRSELVGHPFPTSEVGSRWGALRVVALDESGALLAEARGSNKEGTAGDSPSLTFFIPAIEKDTPIVDRRLQSGEERRLDAKLDLGARIGDLRRVRVELLSSFDPRPIATAERAAP
jgi:hypothetical protein